MRTAFVFWPRIAAGASAASEDHFVFHHRPQYTPKLTDVGWGIGGFDGDFTGRFVGPPSTLLSTLITNYTDRTPYAQSAVDHGVLRTDLSVNLARDATVGQMQPAFDRVKATVTGMMEARSIISIRIPTRGRCEPLLDGRAADFDPMNVSAT